MVFALVTQSLDSAAAFLHLNGTADRMGATFVVIIFKKVTTLIFLQET